MSAITDVAVSAPSRPTSLPLKLPFLFHVRSSNIFILLTVGLGLFTDMAVYSILMPFLPFMLDSLQNGGNLNNQPDPSSVEQNSSAISKDSGILLAVYAVGLIGSSPVFGYLGDRMKTRRFSNLLGISGLLLATVMFAFSTTYWMLIIARFAQGVSGSCVWTIGLALIADTFPPSELGTQMGNVFIAYSIGLLAGPPIGGAMYYRYGTKPPFFLCISLAGLDLILRLLLIERRGLSPELLEYRDRNRNVIPKASSARLTNKDDVSKEISSEPVNSEKDQSLPSTSQAIIQESTTPKRVSTLKLIKHSRMLSALLLALLNSILFSGLEATLPLHLASEFGFDSNTIGLVTIATVLPGFIASPVSGYIVDRIGPKIICCGSMIVSGAMFMLLGLPNHNSGIWPLIPLLVIVGGAGTCFITPVISDIAAVVNEQEGKHGDGFAISYALFNASAGGGMIIGPILCGFLYSSIGFFYLAILIGIVLIVFVPFPYLYTGGKGKLIQRSQPATYPSA